MTDPTTPAQVDLDSLLTSAEVAESLQCCASVPAYQLRALIAEVRAHRAREVFLECPACEQPCRAMPGEPSYQWWDGDSGECACGAKVTVEADGECAELVLAEQDDEAPPAVNEPTP